MKYGLDQNWYGERDRLRSLSAVYDRTTIEWCERSGLGRGARVLELGAGAGSVAEAMDDRVGREGRVVAVDRDTHFLVDMTDRVEVVEMDVLREPLPVGPFDLVHARMLLAHLGDPVPILRQWVSVLAPGGWLVVEDVHTAGCGESVPTSNGFFGRRYRTLRRARPPGLRLPALLREVSLSAIEAVTVRMRPRGSLQDGLPPWDLLAAQLVPPLIAAGRLTPEEYAEFTRVTHDPNAWAGTPAMTTARGQRSFDATTCI